MIAAVERASGRAWPPREMEPLLGWRLRHGGARSRRLDSAQTARFDGGADLGAAIARVERWYAERRQPACFQLTEASAPSGLDAALAARGYARVTPTTVMTAAADAIDAAVAPEVELVGGVAEIELAEHATPDVLAALCDAAWPDAIRREREALFARIEPSHRFAIARVGGRPAASGLCVVDGELAGLFSMRTQPGFRRRGLARSLLAGLVAWARSAGARRVYLQVEDADAAARPLYLGAGFAPLYRYHYRELAPS